MNNPFKAQYTFKETLLNGVWSHIEVSNDTPVNYSGIAIPKRATLNIDMDEVAKLQAERDELYARIYPNRKY